MGPGHGEALGASTPSVLLGLGGFRHKPSIGVGLGLEASGGFNRLEGLVRVLR